MPQNPEIAAKELLTAVWSPTWEEMSYPIDPAKVAERLGVKVFKADLNQQVSGMLLKQPARDPEIYLNGSDSPNRQRFSCAHELGHYVKRTSVEGSAEAMEYVDFRDPLSAEGLDPEEVWANQFAAALLMPRELVKRAHKELHSPAALAGEFGVSTDAMNFRLQNLGLH
jgi:Zn-dependent peptidase ImmA (M78 family)